MARARRVLAENLPLVDVVIEIVDARIPYSSRNPEIDKIFGSKPRVIVCNKKDLADENISGFWKNYYGKKGIKVIFTDSKKGDNIKSVTADIKAVMEDKIKRELEKGRKNRVIRVMVAGIPNVGKSSFINRVTGTASAVTGDKPGVTRNKQWLKMNSDIELLDTPGLLWPKFDDKTAGFKLACTGAIKDDILDQAELASELLTFLEKHYPGSIAARFNLEIEPHMTGYEILELCGKKRGCIISKGEVDSYRIAAVVLDEFRGGKLGRITLDWPDCLELGDVND
jgi:ribosome biogenesis GTPase A